jgi:hypothetical protein
MEETIVDFDFGESAYGRRLHSTILINVCDKCKKDKLILSSDTSDGEYGPLSLCKDCILEMFNNY